MTVSAVSPCRTAFWRDLLLPPSEIGPVLRRALRRLASICRSEVIGSASRWLRLVVLSDRRCIVRSESGTVNPAIQFVSRSIGDLDSMSLLPQSGSDAQRFDPVAAPPG